MISERLHLEEKLDEYKFLSPDEEKQIVELDESVEAIDAAIDYKNDIMRQVGDRWPDRYMDSIARL